MTAQICFVKWHHCLGIKAYFLEILSILAWSTSDFSIYFLILTLINPTLNTNFDSCLHIFKDLAVSLHQRAGEREREGEREGGREWERGREGGREGGQERGREGEREWGREGGRERERGREGGRKREGRGREGERESEGVRERGRERERWREREREMILLFRILRDDYLKLCCFYYFFKSF